MALRSIPSECCTYCVENNFRINVNGFSLARNVHQLTGMSGRVSVNCSDELEILCGLLERFN